MALSAFFGECVQNLKRELTANIETLEAEVRSMKDVGEPEVAPTHVPAGRVSCAAEVDADGLPSPAASVVPVVSVEPMASDALLPTKRRKVVSSPLPRGDSTDDVCQSPGPACSPRTALARRSSREIAEETDNLQSRMVKVVAGLEASGETVYLSELAEQVQSKHRCPEFKAATRRVHNLSAVLKPPKSKPRE